MVTSKLPLPSDSCSGLESSAVELKPPVVVVKIVIAQHVAFSNGFPVEKVIFMILLEIRAARIVAALRPGCEEMERERGNEEEMERK